MNNVPLRGSYAKLNLCMCIRKVILFRTQSNKILAMKNCPSELSQAASNCTGCVIIEDVVFGSGTVKDRTHEKIFVGKSL